MGYSRHHAIVVTTFDNKYAQQAHAHAVELGMAVSSIIQSPTNGYASFFVAPDGSKEGWQQSADGDQKRSELIRRLDTFRYEDGSSPLRWAEMQYGDDEGRTLIVSHSEEDDRLKAGNID